MNEAVERIKKALAAAPDDYVEVNPADLAAVAKAANDPSLQGIGERAARAGSAHVGLHRAHHLAPLLERAAAAGPA